MFSPTGHAIAFVSNESGRDEVYVQPFPSPGARVRVSTSGGTEPTWSRDGKELFYREGTAMKSVRFSGPRSFEPGAPSTLFEGRYEPAPYGGRQANYDVAADGRFLMIRRKNLPQPTTIHIVLNWPAALLPAPATGR